jgi:hypothetical protein
VRSLVSRAAVAKARRATFSALHNNLALCGNVIS